jgi:hypothetical protein
MIQKKQQHGPGPAHRSLIGHHLCRGPPPSAPQTTVGERQACAPWSCRWGFQRPPRPNIWRHAAQRRCSRGRQRRQLGTAGDRGDRAGVDATPGEGSADTVVALAGLWLPSGNGEQSVAAGRTDPGADIDGIFTDPGIKSAIVVFSA